MRLNQSNFAYNQSISPDLLKISQSINRYIEKKSINIDMMDENTIKDCLESNLLFEEENNTLKAQNENLKKQLEELKKQIELKKENENPKTRNRVLAHSVNSDDSEEEEYDVNYLANTAKKKNNSEDMKIDFPGLSDVNEKYEELKNKMIEIKEIFKDIKSKVETNNPELKIKMHRVFDLLEKNP